MNSAIEGRELISVTVAGALLRGTYHHAIDENFLSGVNSNRKLSRPGLLFLNHGFLPKSAPGDSAVFWCERITQCGYPCFRFDLPGLGDSDGEAPARLLEFMNAGGYAAAVAALVKALVERYGLTKVVIVGHCACAVSALFAAPQVKECAGLILTDPYFFVPRERTRIWMLLRHWSSWSRIGATLSSMYYLLRHVRHLVGRNRLPRNANFPLLQAWKQLSSAGTPMLVLKAPALKTRGLKPRIGDFDYLGYLQSKASPRSRVSIEFIEGTNHSFADRKGRTAVVESVERWLSSQFCVSPKERAAGRTASVAQAGAYEAFLPR